MNSILLTLTLKSESENDSILIEHLKKFRAGKGIQERSFEIRRLLHAGLLNQRQFSESFEVRNQSPYQNASIRTVTTPDVNSSKPHDDFSHNSSKTFTGKTASSIPEINLGIQVENVHQSVRAIAAVGVDTKRNIEPPTQSTPPALSLSEESVNAENSDLDRFAEIRKSVSDWDFGMAKQAENTNVTTGEIT